MESLTAWCEVFQTAHTGNTDEFVIAITIALTPLVRISEAAEKLIMADHSVRTIPVVFTDVRVISLTDTPVIDTFCVLATIAIRTTASIDFTAHVVDAPLVISAVTVFTTTLNNNLFVNATIGFFVTYKPSRTGAIVSAADTSVFHRHTNALIARNLNAFRPLGTVSIGSTGDQT